MRGLSRYRESGVFGDVEKLVLDLAVAMTRVPVDVSDDLFSGLQSHFTPAQLVELTSDIAQANFRGRFNRAFRCEAAGFSGGAFCPMPQTERS